METYVRISSLNSDIEAAALDVILNEQGIPHQMQSYHDSAYDGIFQDQKGWGCVMAPPTPPMRPPIATRMPVRVASSTVVFTKFIVRELDTSYRPVYRVPKPI